MQGSSDIDIYNQRGQVYFQAKNYRKVGANSSRPRVGGDLALIFSTSAGFGGLLEVDSLEPERCCT